jgi:hypothetical protein
MIDRTTLACAAALVLASATSAVAQTAPPAISPPAATVTPPVAEKPANIRLVEAARTQVSLFVLYSPAYVKLAYPGGDIPPYQGVCTDVIVRAYRTAFGHDLQKHIHEARVGLGDRNIDHRRVVVQRKYFAKRGKSIPLPKNPAADPSVFQPGDIVTYQLPPGGFSPTHVAIVSDRRTPEGRPLVIHNRGLGVQEEDALLGFPGWKLTGHYRYLPTS